MSFETDAAIVREYVRTLAGDEVLRVTEQGDERIAVVIAGGVDRHTEALNALINDYRHVHIIAVPPHAGNRVDAGSKYWKRRRAKVFVAADQHETGRVSSLSFSEDDDGPFLGVGLLPFTDDAVAEAVRVFRPYRIKAYRGNRATPAGS